MSDFEKELIESAKQARAIARGEIEPARVYEPKQINIVELRTRLGMTQEDFATRYGFKVSALREWEQGRRSPARAARVLLMVIDQFPDIVERVLEAEQPELLPA